MAASVDDQTEAGPTRYDLDGTGGSYTVGLQGTTLVVQHALTGKTVWQYLLPEAAGPCVFKVADVDATAGLEVMVFSSWHDVDAGKGYCFDFAHGDAPCRG
jgi:hypothetical protein